MIGHYCIFNDVDTRDLGLFLQQTPPKIIANERVTTYTVPGRSGVLTVSDESFEPIVYEYSFYATDISRLSDICRVLRGQGWLVKDDDPDKKYKARVVNQIPFDKTIPIMPSFVVQFECYPFAYEKFETELEAQNNGIIINQGNYFSEPIIEIFGTGSIVFTVNDKPITLKNITSSIVLDTPQQNAYKDAQLMNQNMSGEFPRFELGSNFINWTGNVKSVSIRPNWRWF